MENRTTRISACQRCGQKNPNYQKFDNPSNAHHGIICNDCIEELKSNAKNTYPIQLKTNGVQMNNQCKYFIEIPLNEIVTIDKLYFLFTNNKGYITHNGSALSPYFKNDNPVTKPLKTVFDKNNILGFKVYIHASYENFTCNDYLLIMKFQTTLFENTNYYASEYGVSISVNYENNRQFAQELKKTKKVLSLIEKWFINKNKDPESATITNNKILSQIH